MVTSPRDPPDNVIALSPFRAELGRARRLRRADTLYEAADLGAAVRALPGDELYYVLHEMGLQEGQELLALATAEQLQIVLDFGLWERDQVGEKPLREWLQAMSTAPVERIGRWFMGLDSELVGLILRRGARIYDLSLEEPPEEPEGTFYPTPDRLFVLDVLGGPPSGDDQTDDASVVIRLVDALYRADNAHARRILVGARGELDAELEENAYRWRQARMADLGFSDYYEALEVYRELDPATVRFEAASTGAGPPLNNAGGGATRDAALRVPTALAERLRDTGASPFARAAQKLGEGAALEDLRSALVALTNRVLTADRVAPGDDEAVAAVLERLAATLDLAVERLAAGDDERGAQALREVPLVRLFRLGFSLTARVRRLALALRRGGPFGARGFSLAEPDDAAVLEAVTQARPMFPRLLDDKPAGAERPFRALLDLARAAAAIERAATAQAMLHGLGVTPADVAPGSATMAAAGDDEAAIDAGLLARTALVARLSSASIQETPVAFRPLEAKEVKAFEVLVQPSRKAPPKLPAALEKKARTILAAAAPPSLVGAATAVGERWISSLAPLEPVIVRKPSGTKPVPVRKPPETQPRLVRKPPETKRRR